MLFNFYKKCVIITIPSHKKNKLSKLATAIDEHCKSTLECDSINYPTKTIRLIRKSRQSNQSVKQDILALYNSLDEKQS